MNNRMDFINACIQKVSATKYLEIGVQSGDCFRAINCDYKVGVDPDKSSAATIHKTSDDFFAENKEKFSVIFIDGLHESTTVNRDIQNSLDCLEEGGIILMHDCLPTNEFMQLIPLTTQNEWCGDVWRSFVKYRMERGDLEMFVLPSDWGVGVIRKGSQCKLVPDASLTYENFEKHKEQWMNVISIEEFQKWLQA